MFSEGLGSMASSGELEELWVVTGCVGLLVVWTGSLALGTGLAVV